MRRLSLASFLAGMCLPQTKSKENVKTDRFPCPPQQMRNVSIAHNPNAGDWRTSSRVFLYFAPCSLIYLFLYVFES